MPPCSVPACWWWMQAFGLLLHWELWLDAYSVFLFCFFPSQLCCPLRFQNSPQTRWWEGFLEFGNFSSFMTPSPGWVSIPNSFVSLFVFYILSYLLSKRMGCLSGCLMSSARVQKLFCGSCSAFKWSFDEFVGEKMVSPSYSSTILAQGNIPTILRSCQFGVKFSLELLISSHTFCPTIILSTT